MKTLYMYVCVYVYMYYVMLLFRSRILIPNTSLSPILYSHVFLGQCHLQGFAPGLPTQFPAWKILSFSFLPNLSLWCIFIMMPSLISHSYSPIFSLNSLLLNNLSDIVSDIFGMKVICGNIKFYFSLCSHQTC